MVIQDHKVTQVALGIQAVLVTQGQQVLTDLLDRKAILDLLATLAALGIQAVLATQDHKVTQVVLVTRVVLDIQVHLAILEVLVIVAHLVIVDLLDMQVVKGPSVTPVVSLEHL